MLKHITRTNTSLLNSQRNFQRVTGYPSNLRKSSKLANPQVEDPLYEINRISDGFKNTFNWFKKSSWPNRIYFTILGTGSLAFLMQEYFEIHVFHSFLKIKNPLIETNPTEVYGKRKEAMDIAKIIGPKRDPVPSYYLIIGNQGSGKSTLVELAERQFRHGITHINGSSNLDKFGQNFSKAINYKEFSDTLFGKWLIRLFLGKDQIYEKKELWEKMLDKYEELAKKAKWLKSYTPVLIFDEISELAKENPNVLRHLQNEAKRAANKKIFTTIFVSNDIIAFDNLLSNSAISNCKCIHIGNMSKEESMDYLKAHLKIDQDFANQIYDVFGGQISDLSLAAKEFKCIKEDYERVTKSIPIKNKPSEEDKNKYLKDNLEKYIKQKENVALSSWVSIPHHFEDKILNFFNNNFEKSFSKYEFISLFSNEDEGQKIFQSFMDQNIFAYDQKYEIILGSPLVKYAIENKCKKLVVQEVQEIPIPIKQENKINREEPKGNNKKGKKKYNH